MESDTAINHDETELSFAAKIDYLQPSGAYNTTLEFNIVANPLVDYMQNLDPALCTTTPTTVLDKRDNEEYTIQRLADGNCWMLGNLRLDIADSAVQAKLNSTTTNATDTILGYLKNGGGSSPYPASGVVAKTAAGGSWADSYNLPYIATAYKDINQATSGSAPAGKIGIYYNYCAASAGSYCYAANASSGDASYDICPKGWRMPTGGSSGEYQALYTAYGNAANFMSALSTPLSGNFSSGTAYNQGTYGYFWSSTRNDGDRMYTLYVDSSSVYPQNYYARNGGFSVRCVLDQTMQGFTTADADRMAVGDVLALKDIRDGQVYTVTKLPDNNVWMTRNLAIGCNGSGYIYGTSKVSRTLTNVDSNIGAASYTLPTTSLTNGNSYTNAYIECYIGSGTTFGGYYNYTAATAGTVSGTSTTESTSDICPAGWRLPTMAEAESAVNYKANFNVVTSACWYSGAPYSNTINKYGYWWTSSPGNANNQRYTASWYAPEDRLEVWGNNGFFFGYSIRCVKK